MMNKYIFALIAIPVCLFSGEPVMFYVEDIKVDFRNVLGDQEAISVCGSMDAGGVKVKSIKVLFDDNTLTVTDDYLSEFNGPILETINVGSFSDQPISDLFFVSFEFLTMEDQPTLLEGITQRPRLYLIFKNSKLSEQRIYVDNGNVVKIYTRSNPRERFAEL